MTAVVDAFTAAAGARSVRAPLSLELKERFVSEPHLLVDVSDHICTLTLNDPRTKNAFSKEMMVRVADAWEMCERTPEIRVVILTGAGNNFSSGANLKEQVVRHETEWQRRLDEDPGLWMRAFLRTKRLQKPVIAAVEGYALAGGTEILQGTDIRVAGRSATFGVREVKLGLFPLGGSTVRLQRQIPYTLAAEMLLLGKSISAEEAQRYGLIGRVVDDGEALAEARAIATEIASNGPLAVQAVLRSMRETADLPEEEALKREFEIGWPRIRSAEADEGRQAFAEKRAPRFTGVEE